jgi:two-component system, OmpR family, sensor kinase
VAVRQEDEAAMRRFFADASHELRTPLASIRANAELAQQGALPERAQVDEAMRRIGLEAERMSRLVDDMLGLARLGQAPEPRRQTVDLAAVVAEAVAAARLAAPSHRFEVVRAAPATVLGDPELLRRAVDNLFVNVTAHTPPGTTAGVAVAAGDGLVRLSVRDDGPGVPPDQVGRVFDRFFRGGAVTRPGSGLGLAIVAEVVATLGGSVSAGAVEPHGLEIVVELPEAQPPSAS